MLTKAIKYTDYNGIEKVKNFYFNLTKAELMEMNLSENGGIEGLILNMINNDDNKQIVKFFKDFVLLAVGEKSADGEYFIKNDEIRQNFLCHPAYDILFMELIAGGELTMSDFVNALIPRDVAENISKNPGASRERIKEALGYDPLERTGANLQLVENKESK